MQLAKSDCFKDTVQPDTELTANVTASPMEHSEFDVDSVVIEDAADGSELVTVYTTYNQIDEIRQSQETRPRYLCLGQILQTMEGQLDIQDYPSAGML